MTHEEVLKKLQFVFREVFDDNEVTISDATTANDIEDWDSLTHMQLITEVEETFGIKFNIGEINSFANVGEMVRAIKERAEK